MLRRGDFHSSKLLPRQLQGRHVNFAPQGKMIQFMDKLHPLQFHVRQQRGEHERWIMEVREDVMAAKPFSHCDQGFGRPGSREYPLVKGKTYVYRLKWVDTNLYYDGQKAPDFDWRCLINGSAQPGVLPGLRGTGPIIVEDPDGLLTFEKHGNDVNITKDKEGRIHVPKVEAVEWKTYEGNTALDACPRNGGKRIFPDKQTPTDNNAAVRKKVTARAKIAPALANQTVYFRAFDVDDPSSEEAPVDGNDTSGPAGADNRGTGHALSASSAQTDASGYASVEFTVSMQPGDNFKVFASLDAQELNSLTQNKVDADSVPSGIAQSEMLTVWRRLWLEFDSMGPVAVSGNEKNFEEGTIASVQQNVPVIGQCTLNVGMRLQDDENRYKDGCITIDGTIYPVLANSDNLILDDTVVVNGMVPTSASGKTFAIYDDDYDPVTLTLLRPLPYALGGGELIHSAFGEAYIKPVDVPPEYVDMDDTFYRNLDVFNDLFPWASWEGAVNNKKDLQDTADFWVVHLLAAYQAEAHLDRDPHMIGNVALDTLCGKASDTGNTGVIFLEPLRELNENWNWDPRVYETHTVVHEIGHQGGALHSDGGIMTEGAPINKHNFEPITLDRFRSGVTF